MIKELVTAEINSTSFPGPSPHSKPHFECGEGPGKEDKINCKINDKARLTCTKSKPIK